MGFSEKITSVMRTSPPTDDEEHQHPKPKNENDSSSPSDEEGFSKDAQIGVRKVEASAMVWTKGWLIAVYAL